MQEWEDGDLKSNRGEGKAMEERKDEWITHSDLIYFIHN